MTSRDFNVFFLHFVAYYSFREVCTLPWVRQVDVLRIRSSVELQPLAPRTSWPLLKHLHQIFYVPARKVLQGKEQIVRTAVLLLSDHNEFQMLRIVHVADAQTNRQGQLVKAGSISDLSR